MSEIQIALEDYVRMLKAEIIRLKNQSHRLREAMAKAAQRADNWPDSNDDPSQVLSDVAAILYDALDVRFLRPDPLSQALNEGDGVYRP